MNIKDLRIVFMGTPDFATASLKALYNDDLNIVGVITAADKLSGRGLKLQYSSVKKYCLEKNLKILQPEKLKKKEFIEELKSLNGNLFIVVAFRMLPEIVWKLPEFGTINLHASILPQYRGAAPINWAIINGEKETGLTTFFIDEEIDTGKIIDKVKLRIGEDETAGELHDRLMIKGAELLKKTIRLIASGNVKTSLQSELTTNITELKKAPKINKEDCRINWDQPYSKVHNFIRGLNPWPGAWTIINSHTNKELIIKILKSECSLENIPDSPGTIKTDGKNFVQISCSDAYLNILEIQAAGKKRMKIMDFLRGIKDPGWINCEFPENKK